MKWSEAQRANTKELYEKILTFSPDDIVILNLS